jgi:hypothetical protein
MYYGGMLPARVVLEHNPTDYSYRTFMEPITDDGQPGIQWGRYFYWEATGKQTTMDGWEGSMFHSCGQ